MADFNDVVSRRKFLQGSFALGSGAFIAATIGPAKATGFLSGFNGISFNPVPANGKDTITLPKGFSWHKVASWGDPLWSGVDDFDQITRGTGESQKGLWGIIMMA